MRFSTLSYGALCLLGFTYIMSNVSGYNMIGCYIDNLNNPSLKDASSIDVDQSSQKCGDFCSKRKTVYAGIRDGSTCMCGNDLPSESLLVKDDLLCNIPCPGAPQEKCGGKIYMSVWIVGSKSSYDSVQPVTGTGQSTNMAGLIGGIVGGVIGLLLILGGGFWWYRKKQRNQKVNNLGPEKYGPGFTTSWRSRSRSDLSLRDDFDYTHTLRVTNPDP
ncbi:hypothetical protein K7432_010090 [Basidiobolus ranarum]|uniref:WSC domain-containing protein n=1 Tax=Basidiobolus ranarum TaxID=34480 RepID=A0ABR2WPA9_9FUNG